MDNNLENINSNRKNNIVWTISKDFNYIPDYRIFSFEDDEKVNFYKSALVGFSYNKFQMNKVYKFLNYLIDKNLGSKDYIKLVELILEQYFWEIYEKERPGIIEFRNYTMNKKYIELTLSNREQLFQELELAFYSRKKNIIPKSIGLVNLLIEEILNIDDIKDTTSLLNKLEFIMKKFFYINTDFNFDDLSDSLVDNNEEEQEDASKPKIFMKNKDTSSFHEEEVESAEFNKSSFMFNICDFNVVDECDTITIPEGYGNFQNFKLLSEEVYGKNILNYSTNKRMENLLCTDIHNGIEILITKGEYRNGSNESFRVSERNLNIDRNEEHFNKNILSYKRSITKLKDIIQKEILTDLEENRYLSKEGVLIPSLLWKHKYLNDNKVFYKEIKDELGTVSVDILLDSSASQFERQESVASQGYIISQALTELNIPTRVISFNNFYNILVLRVFRDYYGPISTNKKIFEYTASSSNRDGIAIKTMRYLMHKFESQRKILIVLSDGKPNDKLSIKILGKVNNMAKDYIKEDALKDTAKEIFLTRNSEITLLGVFTGEVEDLPDEKRIFGNDFAYIHDINRFSDIVGKFLKNVFHNTIN